MYTSLRPAPTLEKASYPCAVSLTVPGDRPTLTGLSFGQLSRAQATLDRDRQLLARSEELLRRSRTLCEPAASLRAVAVAAPSPGTPSPAVRPSVGVSTDCAHRGCPNPAVFRASFLMQTTGQRVAMPNVPLRVCALHRNDLALLFRQERVLGALRQLVRRRSGRNLGDVTVRFETLN